MAANHTLLQRFVELLEELRRLELARNPLRGIGISPPQFALLDRIARKPGATLGEIAAALGVTPPTISVALRRLEELKLVRKSRDPRDRRNIRVYLTAKGEALHREAAEFKRLRAERLLSPLPPAERAELVRLLEKALRATEERGQDDHREGA